MRGVEIVNRSKEEVEGPKVFAPFKKVEGALEPTCPPVYPAIRMQKTNKPHNRCASCETESMQLSLP